ncbi:MAG TPA: DNA translocase FtsK 4TM domain-containing protein [Armatimonadota bacterium]|jgi:S-DNA-T family DNA segregation ATPase FtsK/SpoIIIE
MEPMKLQKRTLRREATRSRSGSSGPRKVATAPMRPVPRRRSRRQLDITGISLVALALVSAISLVRPAWGGAVGTLLVEGLRYLFGVGGWAFVGLMVFVGVLHLQDREHRPPMDLVAGGGLLFLAFLWLAQIARVGMLKTVGAADAFGTGGGLVGAAITASMTRLFGVASWVVMGLIALVAVVLIVDMPVHRLVSGASRRAKAGAKVVRERAAVATHGMAAIARREPKFAGALMGRRDDAAIEAEETPELPLEPKEYEKPRALALRIRRRGQPEETPGLEPTPEAAKPVVASRAALKVRELSPEKPSGTPAAAGDYVMPSLDLLNPPPAPPARNEKEAQETIETLETTLAQFHIEAKVVEISRGPTVTRFEIQLAPGIKVSKIVNLADNLAMALAAIDVRVEAPIPGKSAIGIEVPSRKPALVSLRQCLETKEFFNAESKLTFAIGVDVAGQPRYADLAKMPHMLIGGSTNSGKSVCLNTLIASLLYRARPDEVKLILIDPKRVELTPFDGIPHLIHPVIKDVRQASGMFKWTIKEMERRYDLFVKVGARNILGYNERITEDEKPLPYIVLIVDELADLMMQLGHEVEEHICRLAQLARATGIHLIIATQRPSVDVVTGLIKANIGSRIAFAVASHTDSRTILNMNGAERLIGRGDLLYMPIDAAKPTRMQGPYISEREVDRLVAHIKEQGEPEYVTNIASGGDGDSSRESGGSDTGSDDELFERVVRLVVTTGQASTSMLQRKFKIGYTRAARLVDIMQEQGIVGPSDGAKPREVLINRTDLDILFGNVPPMPGGPNDPFTD